MPIIRLYNSDDAQEGDRLLSENKFGDVNLKYDNMVVAEWEEAEYDENGKVTTPAKLCGLLAGRLTWFVHEFHIDPSTLSRLIAEKLLAYALGFAKAQGSHTALFIIARDNVKMHRFMEENGAWREADGVVYKMNIR